MSPELYRQLMASPSPNSFFEDKIEEAFSGKRTGRSARQMPPPTLTHFWRQIKRRIAAAR